jgi:hypothetical protein
VPDGDEPPPEDEDDGEGGGSDESEGDEDEVDKDGTGTQGVQGPVTDDDGETHNDDNKQYVSFQRKLNITIVITHVLKSSLRYGYIACLWSTCRWYR